jgi:hypothetical protein
MAVRPRVLKDGDRLRLLSIPPQIARDYLHPSRNYKRTKCLSLLLMAQTVGEYRQLRVEAGLEDHAGGYLRQLIELDVIELTRAQ